MQIDNNKQYSCETCIDLCSTMMMMMMIIIIMNCNAPHNNIVKFDSKN